MKRIGLFFGTFNPVHTGHLILAEYMLEYTDLEEIWFVVTPHNPAKNKKTLLPDRERLHMVNLAIEEREGLRASDVEFSLPQPNYTSQTLTFLRDQHPEKEFVLIMGEDNANSLPKWRNCESILDEHDVYTYPRMTDRKLTYEHPRVTKINAPILEISATALRDAFRDGKRLTYLLPKAVFEYIEGSNLYH